LGLSLQTVTEELARQEHLGADTGALAVEAFADGPAAAAGIRKGDVVVAIDGQAVASADAAVIAVREHAIGEEVEVVVVRGLEQLTLTVTLGSDADMPEGATGEVEKPDDGPAPPTDDEQQDLLDQIYSG
jgi:putative serine protease PepD